MLLLWFFGMSDNIVNFPRVKARPRPVLVKDDKLDDRNLLRRLIDVCYSGLIDHDSAKAIRDIRYILKGERRNG